MHLQHVGARIAFPSEPLLGRVFRGAASAGHPAVVATAAASLITGQGGQRVSVKPDIQVVPRPAASCAGSPTGLTASMVRLMEAQSDRVGEIVGAACGSCELRRS
eukprot:761504-Amphidinium_carterae.1